MNGRLVPESAAKISVFDHGLLYGDGVFEGIRSYNGRVFALDEHIDRLYRSAKAIALEIPISKQQITKDVIRTCKANKTMNGYIRLVVTRGVGTLGLNPFICKTPQIIIIAAKIQLYPKKLYDTGLKVITAGTIRNHSEACSPSLKSLNYLNNVLGKIEAINAGCIEAIMLNQQGFVSEATGDNIFAVTNGCLRTPPTHAGILDGITRKVVMELATQNGYEVAEETLMRYDLYTADEVFLTGTAAEVIAVVDIDRRKIGAGQPGIITKKLAKQFTAYARSVGTPIK